MRVNRYFRDTGTSLLYRHIARWKVTTRADGLRVTVYESLRHTSDALYTLIDQPTYALYVRYLDIETEYLRSMDESLVVRRELHHSLWTGLNNLVALVLKGRLYGGMDLALTGVHFPRLRRLRVDAPFKCAPFICSHLPALTHLRIKSELPVDVALAAAEPPTVGLTHYHGPIQTLLRLGLKCTTIQYCALMLYDDAHSDRESSKREVERVMRMLHAQAQLQTLVVCMDCRGWVIAEIIAQISSLPPFDLVKDMVFTTRGGLRHIVRFLRHHLRSIP